MNVIITGITGMRNRGVEAIIAPTLEQIKQRQPDVDVSILTWTPDYDRIRLSSYEANFLFVERSIKKLLLSKLFPFFRLKFSPYSKVISNTSAVIASGGDVFSPEYDISVFLEHLEFALAKDIPIILFAQSISPYKNIEQTRRFLAVARRAKLITAREIPTYNYLTQELGLSTDIVKLIADPAFLLAPASKKTVDAMLKNYGISGTRPIVSIATSQGICNFASTYDQSKHLEGWQKIIQMLIEELNVDVLIIPHVHEINPNYDDRIIATELLRKLNFDSRVHIACVDHTASEYKGLIAASDLVIAERMHAAIAGLSSGVCTLAVGYSVKAEGIMADLIDPDMLKKGLLISIQDFLEPQLARQAVQFAWDNRQEVAKSIQEKLPQIKEKSARNFDLLADALKGV